MVALECGSDIGGSIHVPAAFCGVFGLKPSFGLVPKRGQGFPGTDAAEVELAVIGPLARTAIDLDVALGVLAGPDIDDAAAYRLALPAPRRSRLAACRLLALDAHPRARTDAVIREAIAALCDDAARAGAEVARQTPLLPDLDAAHDQYLAMLGTIMTRGAPNVKHVISAHEGFFLLDQQMRLRRQWRALFERFDAVIAPAFGCVAYPHVDTPDMRTSTLTIDGEPTANRRSTDSRSPGPASPHPRPAGDGGADRPDARRPANRRPGDRPDLRRPDDDRRRRLAA
jgi:amidase